MEIYTCRLFRLYWQKKTKTSVNTDKTCTYNIDIIVNVDKKDNIDITDNMDYLDNL